MRNLYVVTSYNTRRILAKDECPTHADVKAHERYLKRRGDSRYQVWVSRLHDRRRPGQAQQEGGEG